MEIPFPLGGLNDLPRKSTQPPGTTSEGVNVRGIGRTTGRARGSQRPGTSKYCSVDTSSPTAKVGAICSVVYDARKLDYEGIQPTATDSVFTYTAKDATGMTVLAKDSLGNIYGVYGRATVIKLNPDGNKIWERALPTPDTASICRALCVGDSLEVYVGTSTGTAKESARIWRIDQTDDNKTEIVWEYTPSAYPEALRFAQSQLFSAENATFSHRSYLKVYQGLEANPGPEREVEIPYPVNDMAVRSDGVAYTTHPPFTERGLDPRFPGHTERTVDWTPRDLDNAERRIWFWGKPDEMDYDHDDPVLAWRSVIGKRTLTLAPQRQGPTWNESGVAGNPTISFSGDTSDTTRQQCLISGTNRDVQAEYADQQNTLLPAYKGAQFALFIVVRVNNEKDSGTAVKRVIIAQDNTATPGYSDQILSMNTSGTSASAGKLQWTAQTNGSYPGAGSGGRPFPYDYDARSEDVLLVTAIYNGGLPPISASPVIIQSGSSVLSWYLATSPDRFRVAVPASYTLVTGDTITVYGSGYLFGVNKLTSGATHTIIGIQTIGSTHYVRFDQNCTALTAPDPNIGTFFSCTYEINRTIATTNGAGCVLRVNGNPVDRFYGEPFETYSDGYNGTGLGTQEISNIVRAATGYSPGKMDIAEILVLHNPDYPGTLEPVTCPQYPRSLGDGTSSSPDTSTVVLATDALYEALKIEGYLAHAHGISHLLPVDRVNPSWTGIGFTNYNFGSFPHPYSRFRGPPRKTSDPDILFRPKFLLQSKEGMLVKWAADSGDMVWVATGYMPEAGIGYTFAVGGIGYGLALGEDEEDEVAIFTYGPPGIGLGGTDHVGIEDYCIARKFKDTGDEWDAIGVRCTSLDAAGVTSAGLWSKTWFDLFAGTAPTSNAAIWDYQYGRMCSDAANNAYIPVALGSTAAAQLVVIRSDGGYTLTPDDGFVSTTSAADAYAVLAASPEPVYDESDWGDSSANDSQRAEFFYLAYADGAHADFEKVRFANLASTTGSPRQTVNLCVVNGNIRTFTTSAVTTPSGGAGALDADSETYACAQAFGEVFFTDGTKYRVYNPKTGLVSRWRSNKPGGIPEKCKGLDLWRGRVVLYRGADNPHNYFMSAFDDPYDFDVQPPVVTKTMAIAGSGIVGPGLVPDIINTFIPYTDDLAFWGCDHTIFRMTGDPADDGKIDLISDVTGMGFGRCWAKDPNGVIYFWGSRGGVYRMVPGQVPERMTLNRIERRMTELDLASFRVEMAWDTQNNALHVYVIPWGATGSLVSHFVWEAQLDAWWEDRYCESDTTLAPGRQPSCVYVLDGDDPDDRVLVTGCFDGYIRKVDRNAKSDDGQPIDSRVLMGPFTGEDNTEAVLWGNPILVMSDQQDGVAMELLASANPDTPSTYVARVDQGPGRNNRALIRARGSYVWVRLRSNRLESSWEFESLTLDMLNSGAARAR